MQTGGHRAPLGLVSRFAFDVPQLQVLLFANEFQRRVAVVAMMVSTGEVQGTCFRFNNEIQQALCRRGPAHPLLGHHMI